MGQAQATDLVARALRVARTLRGQIPDDVVFHADWGAQFTSTQMYEVCQARGLAQSAGHTGVCWENAMAESFWSTLNTEF